MPGHKFHIVEISVYFTNIWERRQFLSWRDVYITSKSKYYIARQTRGLAGNEATWESTGTEKKEIMVRFDEENTEATLKKM